MGTYPQFAIISIFPSKKRDLNAEVVLIFRSEDLAFRGLNRAVYEASSPLKYIHNEKAPLLVLQGENDIRMPNEEARQVVDTVAWLQKYLQGEQ